jgi:putative copper resistance protein D
VIEAPGAIEALGAALRGLHTACALLVLGTLLCLHLPRADRHGGHHSGIARWRRRWLAYCLGFALTAFLLGFAVLALQLLALESEQSWRVLAERLLRETRFGAVWSVRQGLALATVALLALAAWRPGSTSPASLALLCAGAGLAIAPLGGHSAAVEPAWPAAAAHASHLLAAGAWWGALPALAALLRMASSSAAAPVFARFSAIALACIAVIVAGGIALALIHVQRWPALLGTRYGQLLLLKLLLLVAVLALAAHLRWRLLPALQAGRADSGQRCGAWVLAECGIASLIVLAAAQLAQTVPARHDAIDWWLPFRLSIDATWDTAWTPFKVLSGAALLALALLLGGLALARRVARGRGVGGAAALALGAGVLAVPALSVEAYPETYRKPSVPYQAISVANGAHLFAAHCTACHGASGHGDGPQAASLALPPADLTEPHTALHTAGDIFWWLTYGKPPGAMPGFAAALGEDERWDLINFVRTLSAGYQARILETRIARMRPWLPAVDFAFVDRRGDAGSLKDYRGRRAVLLVFYTLPDSAARLSQLALEHARVRDAGAQVLAVPLTGEAAEAPDAPFPVVADGAAETARTYALLRRTLANLDPRDTAPMPAHMEMLVDRFGYIRARWVMGDGEGWQRIEPLLTELAALAREPQIRPPPDEHVH